MFYVKRKNYAGRWIVRVVQAALIFGVVFYGMNFLGESSTPIVEEAVVVEAPQAEVQVIVIQSEEAQPELDAVDYFYLALDHQMANEYQEAVADYTRAIDLNPEIAASYLNRGVAYEQMGDNVYRSMSDFTEWMMRDDMLVLSRVPVTDNIDFTVPMLPDTRFEIPLDLSGGDIVSIDAVSMNEDEVDPIIVLLDANGRPVAANDDVLRGDGSLASMDSYIGQYIVNDDAQYTLLVSHAGGGNVGVVVVRIEID